MQIVIDISDELYARMKIVNNNGMGSDAIRIILNGTVLPKGHGRLVDADDIDNHIIGHVDTRSCPTIIEADKAER